MSRWRAADHALFGAIESGLDGDAIRIVEDYRAINDDGFSVVMLEVLTWQLD